MSTTPTPEPTAPVPVTPAPAAPAVHSTLDTILNDLLVATQVIEATGTLIPGFGTAIAGGAAIAAKLEAIFMGAYNAHNAIMGKPLDLSILKDETPV